MCNIYYAFLEVALKLCLCITKGYETFENENEMKHEIMVGSQENAACECH